MPRFDNEGFNPKKRIDNDYRDRSVPEEENYYKNVTPDDEYIPMHSSGAEVMDNQNVNPVANNYAGQEQGYTDDELREKREREEYAKMRAAQRAQKKQESTAVKKASNKKKKKQAAIAIVLAIIILLVGMVEGVLAKMNYDEHKDNTYVSAAQLHSDSGVKNILLIGVDARKNQKKETSRPDTMMLISLDTKHHCIKMTSFLRDTWVYVPSLGHEQRLNASTGGNAGYSGVVDAIEYNFGVDVDGYIVTNFEMFKSLVDSVGGVDVTVTKAEAKEVNSHKKRYGKVKLKAGTHTLTGRQALAYCRIRKIDTDFNRTERQRTVMTALLNKAKKNPFRLYKMANAGAEYIETDLTKTQLKGVAAFAAFCVSGEMFQEKVPFEGTWEYANKGGASVIAINVEKNKEKLIDYIYNKTSKQLKAEQEQKD